MSKAVICIVKTRQQAEAIVTHLNSAAVRTSDISLLVPGSDAGSSTTAAAIPGMRVVGSSTGGMIGGVFGLLAGAGVLAVPGAGSFIAAGPIIAALSAAAMGAAIGGIAGGLVWLGIPEGKARRLEQRVKDGDILVSVRSHENAHLARAREILLAENAKHLVMVRERPTPRFPGLSAWRTGH
jgi:hypothetical protein